MAGSPLAAGEETVCHDDLGPCNTVHVDGLPAAYVDWDSAAAGPRVADLAHAIWRRQTDADARYWQRALEWHRGERAWFARHKDAFERGLFWPRASTTTRTRTWECSSRLTAPSWNGGGATRIET